MRRSHCALGASCTGHLYLVSKFRVCHLTSTKAFLTGRPLPMLSIGVFHDRRKSVIQAHLRRLANLLATLRNRTLSVLPFPLFVCLFSFRAHTHAHWFDLHGRDDECFLVALNGPKNNNDGEGHAERRKKRKNTKHTSCTRSPPSLHSTKSKKSLHCYVTMQRVSMYPLRASVSVPGGVASRTSKIHDILPTKTSAKGTHMTRTLGLCT